MSIGKFYLLISAKVYHLNNNKPLKCTLCIFSGFCITLYLCECVANRTPPKQKERLSFFLSWISITMQNINWSIDSFKNIYCEENPAVWPDERNTTIKKTHFRSISLWYEIISSFILNYFQHFQTHQNVSGSLRQFWTKLDIN